MHKEFTLLDITPIPAFDDNYIWLLRHDDGLFVTLVDPGEPEPVLDLLRQRQLQLSAVLITHHHWDHAGAIDELKSVYPEAHFYGPRDARIPGLTHVVCEGDAVSPPGLDATFAVMEVPGHTSTHVAYFGEGCLFCGDTLFAGGCGRVFDGTFDDLAASLQRIAGLPTQTLVYCAHEYTMANLGFAAWVEPDNQELLRRSEAERKRREAGMPTVPSTLAVELQTNPFMRLSEPGVAAAAARRAGRPLETPAQVFYALRKWKDEDYD